MIIFIDRANNKVICRKGYSCLTEKEMLLFEFIIKNKSGKRFNSSDAIEYVWKNKPNVITSNNLYQLTYRLRNKLSFLIDSLNFFIKFGCDGCVHVKRVIIPIKKKYSFFSKVTFYFVSMGWKLVSKFNRT